MQTHDCQPSEQILQELRNVEYFVSLIDIWKRDNPVSTSSDTQYAAVVQLAPTGKKVKLQAMVYIPNFDRGAGRWITPYNGEEEACKRIHALLSQQGGCQA